MQPKPYDFECVAALNIPVLRPQRSSPFCSTFQTRFCMSSFCTHVLGFVCWFLLLFSFSSMHYHDVKQSFMLKYFI